jgi:hypothetical protein
MGFKKDFYKLFLQREGKELSGKQLKNIVTLFAIFLMTFLCIGFGEGGLEYLQIKMDDPFENYLSIPIPYGTDIASSWNEKLDNDSIKQHYKFHRINQYDIFYYGFYNVKGMASFGKGRTIETSSQLLRRILAADNKIKGVDYNEIEHYMGDFKVGLIVSKDYLSKLGIGDKYPPYLTMDYSINNDSEVRSPIPLIAIVKHLPGMADVMSSAQFEQELYSSELPFDISSPAHQRYLRYFIPGKGDASKVKDKITSVLEAHWKGIIANSAITDARESFQSGNFIDLEISQDMNPLVVADVLDQYIKKESVLKDAGGIRTYRYEIKQLMETKEDKDNISVEFDNNDSIYQFAQYLHKLNLEVEMSQVEAKKNFNFVSKLTFIISLFLIVFSILSVSMFLINLIRSHFERIRKNIGTFKAFGLDNRRLIVTYSAISLIFLSISASLAYGLAYLLGYLGIFRFLIRQMGMPLESGYLYFNLHTKMTLITFIIVISLSTIIVVFRLRKMLAKTPGDLIYER